jgi:hypothetical protein
MHITNYLRKDKLKNKMDLKNTKITMFDYTINIIAILLTPISHWTNNNPNIIWFEFNELHKLSEWVTNIIGKPFKIESLNSSKHIKCNIELNDDFIKKYDDIYNFYDIQKNNKTLI